MHVAVLGAGIAGLACAFELLKAGHQVTILEKEEKVGGMAASWQVGPYQVDYGPHRFHSRDRELIDHVYEILDDEVVIRDRMSRIYMQGRFFDYPLKLENVLRNMPPVLGTKAILDYFWIRLKQLFVKIPDDNFENWVLKRFGRTLYDMFFGTYTSKAWKMPCTEISADWASQRISQANLVDAIKKTLKPPKDGESRSLVSEFWYPSQGGIGRLTVKYAEKIRAMGGTIHLGCPVTRLHVEDGRIDSLSFADEEGQMVDLDCDQVVNTIPLPRVLKVLDPPISAAAEAAISKLRYLGIVFIYLEVDQPSVSPDHWVYLPEKHLTVHRISEFKNFCDTASPPDKTVICCEITCLPGDEHWKLTLEEGAQIAERDLVTVGLLPPGRCRGLDIKRLPFAYPVYDLEYKHNLEVLKAEAEHIENLDTTGRQGLYRYNNMDHSMSMGRRVAQTLAEGVDARAEKVATGEEYFG